MGKRNLCVVMLALCAGGCASANVESVGPGEYVVAVPTDSFSSRHAMELYAAEAAGDACPQGWVKLAVKDMPSDVSWTIQCAPGVIAPVAVSSSRPAAPPPDVYVTPSANVIPEKPSVAASAPPESLEPPPAPEPPADDAVPPDKL